MLPGWFVDPGNMEYVFFSCYMRRLSKDRLVTTSSFVLRVICCGVDGDVRRSRLTGSIDAADSTLSETTRKKIAISGLVNEWSNYHEDKSGILTPPNPPYACPQACAILGIFLGGHHVWPRIFL